MLSLSNSPSENDLSGNDLSATRGDVEKAIETSRELQAKGIRLEFKRQREYVDGRFDTITNDFKCQRDYMDGFFSKLSERFENIDDHFIGVDDSFIGVEERFNESDRSFTLINSKLDNAENRTRNSGAHMPWDDIYPVGVYNPLDRDGNSFKVPDGFPNKITKFWHLKELRNLSILTELLQFYGTTGWEYWGGLYGLVDDSDDGSNYDRPLFASLRDAVAKYPKAALITLASHLGLNFFKIKDPILQVKHTEELIKAKKRMAEGSAQKEADKKKTKKALSEPQTIVNTSPKISPPSRRLPVIQPEDSPRERTYMTSSQGTKLGWDTTILSPRPSSSSESWSASSEDEREVQDLFKSSGDDTSPIPTEELQRMAANRVPHVAELRTESTT